MKISGENIHQSLQMYQKPLQNILGFISLTYKYLNILSREILWTQWLAESAAEYQSQVKSIGISMYLLHIMFV